jgi:N-acetylneuraminic acid mutarotase
MVVGCSSNVTSMVEETESAWVTMAPAPIVGRTDHAAVWTGSEMIVFCGDAADGPRADGAAYDPQRNSWRALPAAPIAPRRRPAMFWTGHDVIVHGGVGHNDGARFDPSTNTWTRLPDGPLSTRTLPAYAYAEVTHELIVHGGQSDEGARADGAAFNVETNSWRRIAPSPLGARAFHRAVWTGNEVLIVGGVDGNDRLAHAAATYDPVSDRWRVIDGLPRAEVSALRIDRGVAVLGGQQLAGDDGCPVALADGALYDGTSFAAIPGDKTIGAEAATWFGRGRLSVFGGYRCDEVFDGGASFDAATRIWRALPSGGPSARFGATAIWTGDAALIWGGIDRDGRRRNDGAALR